MADPNKSRLFNFRLSRLGRWLLILCACGIAAGIAATPEGSGGMGWTSYVQSWIGSIFRAASGGTLGWFASRYVIGLDVSAVPEPDRPIAALSQALLIAGAAIAVAVGV